MSKLTHEKRRCQRYDCTRTFTCPFQSRQVFCDPRCRKMVSNRRHAIRHPEKHLTPIESVVVRALNWNPEVAETIAQALAPAAVNRDP